MEGNIKRELSCKKYLMENELGENVDRIQKEKDTIIFHLILFYLPDKLVSYFKELYGLRYFS
jgi:hypothetical protein